MTDAVDRDPTLAIKRLAGRNWTKADIVVYRQPEGAVAVKDYAPRAWWVRQTLGRWMTSRETRAYQAAQGIPGIARFRGRLGPFTLATEWVDAPTLAEAPRPLPDGWHSRLRAVVDQLHDHGIALGDLHRRDILIASDGSVTVIDLATACLKARSGWMFRQAQRQDRIALARLSAIDDPEAADEAVAALGPKVYRHYRRSRDAKRFWNRLRR